MAKSLLRRIGFCGAAWRGIGVKVTQGVLKAGEIFLQHRLLAFAGAFAVTFVPAFTLAHRFFCAARMLASACGDNLRRPDFAGAGTDFGTGAGADP